ncbi:hypothetical protein [Tomitella gaofuii]|uniref:hypothetical protein n=1 Tax=Tomitella gaofuii TaxID=2760083 RepID=UPI0015F7951B|nr:hypothetical protein [Tomitella gaofuii]
MVMGGGPKWAPGHSKETQHAMLAEEQMIAERNRRQTEAIQRFLRRMVRGVRGLFTRGG